MEDQLKQLHSLIEWLGLKKRTILVINAGLTLDLDKEKFAKGEFDIAIVPPEYLAGDVTKPQTKILN